MKKYNVEKVLYFASSEKGLHASLSEEKRNTDLHKIVTRLAKAGHIVEIAEDDSGRYYSSTDTGKIELLRLQIGWRNRNGKCTKEHQTELDRLVSA